jgi:MATE family multidrug resistance protein
MFVGIAGNLFNAALAYGLIYGRFGLPALGVRGGGLGTAITEWLEAIAMLAVLARDMRAHTGATLRFRVALREVTSLGVPTGLHFVGELLAFTLFTVLIGGLGATEIAAHQLALATIRTSFLPGLAISEAACVMVGRALGAGQMPDADRATIAALKLAAGFMAACGVVFAIAGGVIARAFTEDAAVAQTAQRLLWVAAVFQVLDAVNIVLRGALRGAKDVRFTAILGIAVVWTCVPTAAFFLGKLAGLGALGGWLGFIAETTIGAALFWHRWKRGAWRATASST